MAEDVREMILKSVRKDIALELLKKNERADGRSQYDYRKVEVQKGAVTTADGSALATIGGSKVLCGIKFDMMTPFPDRPQDGVFMTMAEFSPLASPMFEPGPPRENSIELARVVDRGIRSAEVIDTASLFIEEGKVLGLFIDMFVLDHSGNLTDTAALAAAAALADTKVPKVEDGAILWGQYEKEMKLPMKPVTSTFIKVGDKLLLDPILDEEYAADAQLTIGTVEGKVSCIQKSKNGCFTKDEVLEAIEVALKKGDELREFV